MPRPIKQRRSKQQINDLCGSMYRIIQADAPMTVRQVFYRMVSAGLIEKSENEYKATVVRLLTGMRRAGNLPWHWIADNTRWMRKPRTFSGLASALARTALTYRRALWDNQDAYVEVWLEKEALAGVLYAVTDQYDVPLMVTRGYPSISYLYEAAATIGAVNKPAYLYYFGDHDPSGLDITRNVERGIRELAGDAEIHFQRIAVTDDQITDMDLPTRPTKRTDSRSRTFQGGSIEVDAIAPADLRELARECIERHIDFGELARLQRIEQAERDTLARMAGQVAA